MPFYWYVPSRDDREIFVDMDHHRMDMPATKVKSFRERVLGCHRNGLLPVESFYIFPSDHPKHFHGIVKLKEPLGEFVRLIWASYLRDDPFRSLHNLMRLHIRHTKKLPRDKLVASLLITQEPYKRGPNGFYRGPDFVCYCREKHSNEVMQQCPVAERLRGDERAHDHFLKPVSVKDGYHFGLQDLDEPEPPSDADYTPILPLEPQEASLTACIALDGDEPSLLRRVFGSADEIAGSFTLLPTLMDLQRLGFVTQIPGPSPSKTRWALTDAGLRVRKAGL